MSEVRLAVTEVTPEAFRPFGRAVLGPVGTPDAENENLSFWSELTSLADVGEVGVALCHAKARPWRLSQMENHLRTYEALIPLEGAMVLPLARYVPGEGPAAAETVLFRMAPGMMLILDPGVWHWLPYPEGQTTGRFLVLFRRGTSKEDLYVADLAEPVTF